MLNEIAASEEACGLYEDSQIGIGKSPLLCNFPLELLSVTAIVIVTKIPLLSSVFCSFSGTEAEISGQVRVGEAG